MTDMSDRPFPFARAGPTMPAMSIDADLMLRGPRDFVRPRLSWPVDSPYGRPMAVYLAEPGSSFDLADALCREAGYIVLALRTEAFDAATIAVEWTADHGRQLGGDPDRLLVAGGRLAAAAALHALDQGWPVISRLVLAGPDLEGYAGSLRDSGIEVVEIDSVEPMSLDWVHGLKSDVDHEEPESDCCGD
jgi:hypothetical protein